MIDIPFRTNITNRTRFIENISGVFPHLERRIYTYILCCCQSTLATIDTPFRAFITSGTRFCLLLPAHYCYDRYFFRAIFSFEQKKRAARVLSGAGSAHLLRLIFLFEPVLRAARAFYRKHFWCFSTFRTKNTHIYLVYFTYIMFSSSKNYKSHSTVLQSCLLST